MGWEWNPRSRPGCGMQKLVQTLTRRSAKRESKRDQKRTLFSGIAIRASPPPGCIRRGGEGGGMGWTLPASVRRTLGRVGLPEAAQGMEGGGGG